MTAYYNEIDPFAAQWLRELIKKNLIAPGDVDERSIEDVKPNELRGYTQCHFFAGIGVWSYALRQAGWSDDRPVWTGSCPCQPFSTAGKGAGFADERHLWPSFHWLISQCRPQCIFGEQVAGKAGETWLDLVSTDLEGVAYACASAVTAACGFGAPHQRKRLYWVADTNFTSKGMVRGSCSEVAQRGAGYARSGPGRSSGDGGVADADHAGPQGRVCGWNGTDQRIAGQGCVGSQGSCPTNNFWRAADWLACRDGKWRPVEPGAFPLAHGTTARVGRLRGYGNAIVSAQAQAFIESYMESL